MSNKTIDINVPVLARVEGEGALDLRIEDGAITDLQLRIYEPPRYFEKFLEGRSYTDVPDTVARICGICPVAYQMSAIHAIEAVFATSITPWARNMRRLMYCGEWLQSHSLHIHMLAAPDFLGFNSVIEMASRYPDEVRRGLRLQGLGNDIIRLLGGRSVHPVGVCAGGFFHAPQPAEISALLERLQQASRDVAELVLWTASLQLPDDEQDFASVSLTHPDEYAMNEGRIVSDRGLDIAIEEFDAHFQELHVPQSTALHCLLHDQPYLVGPLARLNNNLEQLPEHSRSVLQQTGITFPSRNMFHSVVARAVEIHFALHEAIRLLQQYEVPEQPFTATAIKPGTGFGCTEAPRGILWHRYELDGQGNVASARIVPPTSQNQARIEQDIGAALNHFGLDNDEDALRLHAEKVIRNYDPCISCATHFLTLNVERPEAQHVADEQVATSGPLTVLAIGSPFAPDNIAWQLAGRLEQDTQFANKSECTLEVIKLDRPGTELLRHIPETGRVFILDALQTEQPVQQLLPLAPQQLATESGSCSSHGPGVAEALQLAGSLQQAVGHVTVLGIPVAGQDSSLPDATLDSLYADLQHRLLQKQD
jgi:hydrogenase maturation protease